MPIGFRPNQAPLLDRVEMGVPELLCECHLDDAAVEAIDAPDIVDENTRRWRIAYVSIELDHVDSSGWDSAAPHPSLVSGGVKVGIGLDRERIAQRVGRL